MLAVAVGLLAVAVVAIGPGLLPGRTPMPLDLLGLFAPWHAERAAPVNPLLGDVVLHAADRLSIARAWRAGHMPLWSREILAGHPMAGDSSMQPFFPLHVVPAVLFGFHAAFALQLVLQLWLAGIGMAAWARQLVRGWLPVLVAALAWMLAGYQQVWRAYPQFLGTLMWLPFVAAAWEHHVRTGRRGALVLGGAAAALAILGGQVQFAAFGAVVLGLYGLGRLTFFDARGRRRAVSAGAVMIGLGLALGSIGLLPALALARESIRPPFHPDALVATGLPATHLVTAIDPWFMGDPRDGSYRGAQNVNELAIYVGLAPLLLALAAPFTRRDRLAALLAGLALLVAAIALGSPLARLLAALPMLRQFGLMRWLGLWPLVAALLAALALDAVAGAGGHGGEPGRRLRRAVGIVAPSLMVVLVAMTAIGGTWDNARPALLTTALAATAIAWWTHKPAARIRQAAIVAVVGLDLGAFGRGYTPDAPIAAHFTPIAPLDALVAAADAAPGRVAVVQSASSITLGPNVAPMIGLTEIGGYSSAVRSSHRDWLARLTDRADNPYLEQNANMLTLSGLRPSLVAMLDVRYVLASAPLNDVVRLAAMRGGCRAVATLADGKRIATTFTSDADGLNRIDVAVPQSDDGTDGPLAVHLFATAAPDVHLTYGVVGPGSDAEVEVDDGAAAPAHGWRSLYFAPISGSRGRTFELAVDVPDPAGNGDAATASPPHPGRVCVDGDAPAFRAWGRTPPLAATPIASANGTTAYRVDGSLGRGWWVAAAITATAHTAALDAVTAPGFDPAAVVVVEAANGATVAGPLVGAGEPPHPAAPSPPIAVADDGPNRLVAELPADLAAGWLVLAEPYAPGWKATVDGRSTAVLRADGGIRAVAVPGGARTVVLWYDPASVRWSLWLTALGALGVIGLAAKTATDRIRRALLGRLPSRAERSADAPRTTED